MTEAGCGLATAVGHGQRGEVRQLRMCGEHDVRTTEQREARDVVHGRSIHERPDEGPDGVFGFLAAHRVDLGKVLEDARGLEGCEVTAQGDVASVATVSERQGDGQEVPSAPLERE